MPPKMKNQAAAALLILIAVVRSPPLTADRIGFKPYDGDDSIDMKKFTCNEEKKRMFTDDMSYTVRYKSGQ